MFPGLRFPAEKLGDSAYFMGVTALVMNNDDGENLFAAG
jgi:hypothetical protein